MMTRHQVEKIIFKYVPDVAPLFADKFERWPTVSDANKISNALFGSERTYRSLGCEAEAQECFQAAVELQLRKNG
jgi:hypothetical protein